MKLKLFLIAASAMALASCSSDEVVKNNEDANAIQFSVVANNGSRAADYFCNNAKPANFQVWAAVDVTYNAETGAVTGGQSYFQNETFEKGSGTGEDANSLVYTIKGDYRYWPDNTKEVSFWAAKNYKDFTWTVGAPTMTFEAAESAASQHDLLYGYTKAKRPDTGKSVPMNLRHALSQIVFQAKNENSNIDVEINKVEVVNIINSGTYSLPNNTNVTNTNFNDHKQGTNAATTGTWSLGSTKKTFTTEEFTGVAVHGPETEGGTTTKGGESILVNLTNDRFKSTDDHVAGGDNVTGIDFLKNSLLLIPQGIKKFVKPAGAINNTTTETPYFLVYCKIRNVEAGNGTAESGDVYLWGGAGDSEYKAIAVPVTLAEGGTSWAEGKKYVYTFVFSKNGHGGYDPATGNDVLIPIELAVTVDDFSIADQKDVNVNVDSGIVTPESINRLN